MPGTCAAFSLQPTLPKSDRRLAHLSQLAALGVEPTISTPAEFTALMRAELPKWAELVKKTGAKTD